MSLYALITDRRLVRDSKRRASPCSFLMFCTNTRAAEYRQRAEKKFACNGGQQREFIGNESFAAISGTGRGRGKDWHHTWAKISGEGRNCTMAAISIAAKAHLVSISVLVPGGKPVDSACLTAAVKRQIVIEQASRFKERTFGSAAKGPETARCAQLPLLACVTAVSIS